MSTDGMIITTVQHPVTTIHVTLPQNVDECDLIVIISMENSAGVSSTTEIPVATVVPVGVVVILTAGALLLTLWRCKRKTEGEPLVENVTAKTLR